MSYVVYILECRNNRFYTGYTVDLQARFEHHVNGTGKCKFTRSFPPIRIAASWTFPSKSQALKVEHAIKRLSKARKQALIEGKMTLPSMA